MTTENRDFRIKNGLVVQGTTATVNGSSVLTTASVIDNLDDVVITGPIADNEVLAYDSSISDWINQTPEEANLVSRTNGTVTTASTASGVVRNIYTSTSLPSGGIDGDIWMVYS